MIYSHAKVHGQRSVGSEDRVRMNGRMDRRTDAIALHPSLMPFCTANTETSVVSVLLSVMSAPNEHLVKQVDEGDFCRGVGQHQLAANFSSIFQQDTLCSSPATHQDLLHRLHAKPQTRALNEQQSQCFKKNQPLRFHKVV